jgi:hypothetical protein
MPELSRVPLSHAQRLGQWDRTPAGVRDDPDGGYDVKRG